MRELSVSDWLRMDVLAAAGIRDETISLASLEKHTRDRLDACFDRIRKRLEYSFHLIRCRVAMGYLRYESTRGRSPCYLGWLEQSVETYKRTKNLDALLDVAFYAIAEFQNPSFEGTYYKTDKDENERKER